MTLIDRYIIRQISVQSLLALAVVAFIGVANEFRERLSMLPLEYITAGDVLNLALLMLPKLVAYILPITFMFGILMAFGRLSQQGEIAAMTTSGIPLKRVVAPVLILGLLLSVLCFIIQDRVQPWATARVANLIRNELPLRVTLDALPPGTMHDFRGWKVYIARRDAQTGILHDVEILKPDANGTATIYYAQEAQLLPSPEGPVLEMRQGHIILPESQGHVGRVTFQKQTLPLPAFTPGPLRLSSEAQPLEKLLRLDRKLDAEVAETHSPSDRAQLYGIRREISDRFALPLACLAVGCIAAPLGARARGGGRSYTFSMGFLIALGYYLLLMLLVPRSLDPLAEVMIRGLIPDLVLCAAGGWFVWRLDRV